MIASGAHIFKIALFLQHGKIIKGPGELKVSRTSSLTGRELAASNLSTTQLLHQERVKLLHVQKIPDHYGGKV